MTQRLGEQVASVRHAVAEIVSIRRQNRAGTFRGNWPAMQAIQRVHAAFGVFQGMRSTQAEWDAWSRIHRLIFDLADRREIDAAKEQPR